jgi:hypothetical protein
MLQEGSEKRVLTDFPENHHCRSDIRGARFQV